MTKQTADIPKKKRAPLPIAEFTLITITIASLAFGGFFFYKYQTVNDKYKEVTMSDEDRTRQTVAKVAALYNIPSYDQEKPVIYKVSDPEQVKNNTFFKDAQKDDVLLPYPNADIAILFRPSENKIINVQPYKQAFATEVGVALIAPTAKQQSLEDSLKAKFSNIVVTNKSEAKAPVVAGVVVDVTGAEAEAAKTLAGLLGYSVGPLPNGEVAPEGVKLVIIAPTQ